MTRFLFASAILSGSSELVRQACLRPIGREPATLWHQDLAREIGLNHWQGWLQHTPGKDYLIQSIETHHLVELFVRFEEQVEMKNPQATRLRDFLLGTLGKDFGHHSAAPSINLSLNMELAQIPPPTISKGYVLPILPDKSRSYLEFCRQALGEYLYRFQEAYQRLGVTHISYFLQQTPSQNLLVIYQENQQQSRLAQHSSAQFPACRWLFQGLVNFTGLSLEHLNPSPEPLFRDLAPSYQER